MLLKGKTIQLIPYTASEWEHLAKWFYSNKYKGMFRHHPKAFGRVEFENYSKIINGDVFVINKSDTAEVIGLVQIVPDFKTNRGFFLGLLIDEKFQGQRYPEEVLLVLFNYAFNRLGYRKAIIEILADNSNLKKSLTASGFLSEGRLIGESFIDGEWTEELRYVMFSSFFNKKYKGLVDSWGV